ncbi:BCCT family transporter [Actinopolyspora xinjiangensis]|nr:BCCT family transporter [Actinopolyspora xinjiangensis]
MIAGMFVAGSVGCWGAFTPLGNTAMFCQIADIVWTQGNVAGTMAALSQLPLGTVVLAVFVLLVVLFPATTLDSSAYTMVAVASAELGGPSSRRQAAFVAP